MTILSISIAFFISLGALIHLSKWHVVQRRLGSAHREDTILQRSALLKFTFAPAFTQLQWCRNHSTKLSHAWSGYFSRWNNDPTPTASAGKFFSKRKEPQDIPICIILIQYNMFGDSIFSYYLFSFRLHKGGRGKETGSQFVDSTFSYKRIFILVLWKEKGRKETGCLWSSFWSVRCLSNSQLSFQSSVDTQSPRSTV